MLVEQPYRVAGRRSPAPARQLDAAWTAAVKHLRGGELSELPLIVGGAPWVRGWPVAPPPRPASRRSSVSIPSPAAAPKGGGVTSRLPELDEVTVPMLIVQGERDRFGIPPAARHRTVVQVPGDHGLKKDLDAVADAVGAWLPGVVAEAAPATA